MAHIVLSVNGRALLNGRPVSNFYYLCQTNLIQIKMNTFETKEAAMKAAMDYQQEHGGQIIDDITVEIDGFTYGQIAVAFGTIDEDNPTGERWEDFTYEL